MNDVSSIIGPAVVITKVESSSIHKYNKTCRHTLKNCIMKKKQMADLIKTMSLEIVFKIFF